MLDETIEPGDEDVFPEAVEPDQASSEKLPGARGRLWTRVIFYAMFGTVVLLIGVEAKGRSDRMKALEALGTAFKDKGPQGLKLSQARQNIGGLYSMRIRTESTKMVASRGKLYYVVFQWWSVLPASDNWIELEIDSADSKDPLVLSAPYIHVTTDYAEVQPFAEPDSLLLQIQMLVFRKDNIGDNRVSREQVLTVMEEGKAKQDLLDFFDKYDVDKDGVLTRHEAEQCPEGRRQAKLGR